MSRVASSAEWHVSVICSWHILWVSLFLALNFAAHASRALTDRCCFYYFVVRNSLVTLLQALFARILFRFEISACWHSFFWPLYWSNAMTTHLCVCKALVSNKKPFFCPSQPGSCVWLSPFFLCADHTCVLVCVCLCICVWQCGFKMINIDKCKQNCDDVTCNTKVETEIDLHSARV